MRDPHHATTGTANGFSIIAPIGGEGWHWSAYGPRGGEVGVASTKAAAEARARDAHRRLCRPFAFENPQRLADG